MFCFADSHKRNFRQVDFSLVGFAFIVRANLPMDFNLSRFYTFWALFM